MLVKDVMVRDVVTISPFAKLREAMSLMKKHQLKSLVVEQQNASDAFGLITYTDIVKTVISEDGDIDLLNVYDVCAKPAISVGESLALKHVATLMVQQHIKRLLVLHDNQLLGFVTMDDIMDALLSRID
ncbi:CBS domain-containing protein [Vibrio sp. V27_P1S3P104]|uniref:CBS domain-containing protein n=1 Tax=Vibrio TaxID=662 RepID=UPI000C162C52|nr:MULTISPECIES: CBS domain-containing protein [Vibrio]NAW70175.1 CBS domain-containing protein [Vibrio sp. V28_P6S34P95]NAX05550.1 CBS domain-containing protein [Vibrio sp. V30_P3S12P165]NAX36084.1 CBS domain-containing protein [Vibrio sp. V27_P1S3P104]NAX41719.1 CBS domain-containing protein [Vibrio sp. V26_P1S5P106]NNN45224.1 CBS domain-containing protein [Vibrio sp. 1-1(7)]